jgi:GH24 family phage-related lysozyme (muramidase)
MSDLAEQLVAEEEGKSPTVYPDTQGIQTIGIGCVVDPKVPDAGLCDAAISAQFAHDSTEARAIAATYPLYEQMNSVQQAVLVSMSFQLGEKPLHWPHFMDALRRRDYAAAELAGLDSEWARTDSPKRAKRAMRMFSTGSWIAHGATIT